MIYLIPEANPMKDVREINKNQQTAARMAASMAGMAAHGKCSEKKMADALPPAERAVWLILWRDTKPNGLAGTSQMSIARRAGVSDRAVRSALRRLEREGLVSIVHRGSLRAGASIYRVHPLGRER